MAENRVRLVNESVLTVDVTVDGVKLWLDDYFKKAGYKSCEDFQNKQEMLTKEEEAIIMEDFRDALLLLLK